MTTSLRGVALALARDHLAAGRLLRVAASGVSMWPAVRDGQQVVIEPVDAGRGPLRVGDVVLFERGGALVLHRIVARGPGGLLVRGDACARADGLVSLDAVLGRLRRRSGDRLRAALGPAAWRLRALGARLTRRFFDRGPGRS